MPVATRFPYGKDNMLSPRVVNLRREGYFNILKELAKMGVKPENTQVIGDIFELDLALPLFLGYGGILINNGNALEYEKECNNSKFLYAKNMNNLVKIFFE